MILKPNAPEAAHAGKTIQGFNYINGKEVEGVGHIESRSAVDSRDLVGVFPDSGEQDVENAAKAAAKAFKTWSATPSPIRGAVIQRIGQILAEQKERLAHVITREIGKTPREAAGEVQEAIDTCTFFTSEGRRLYGQTVPSEMAHKELYTYRRPIGVCGILAANNFPMAVPSWKIIPAILCGNTVVWKPSDDAPTIAYLFLKAMQDAGIPEGVVNTVNGKGRAGCGKHFLAGIDKGYYQKFSFTGSTQVGRTIGEMCGRNLIIPSLELGGKNPMVVMPDCDMENAVRGALWAAFGTAGQRCTSLANIIVHEACAKEFKQAFMDGLANMEMGNPVTHPEVTYGPMINARFAQGMEEHWVMGAKDKGAKLLSGGAQWTEANRTSNVKGDISHGIYMQPCVWDDVTQDTWLFQTEVFGPTVNISTVKDFDQAMDYANGTPYGLVAGVWTRDLSRAHRLAGELQAGNVWLNCQLANDLSMPFGGYKQSGWGRENGFDGVEAYLQTKAVFAEL